MSDPELLADLRAAVRDVCVDLGGPATVRTLDGGWDTKAWSLLADQVGIAALGLPETVGGYGGVAEIAVVAEELGYHLLPVPFLTSTVMAGQILASCTDAPPDVLEAIAAGREVAALARGTVTPGGVGAAWLVLPGDGTVGLVDLRGTTPERLESLDLSRPCARRSSAGAVALTADTARARNVIRVAVAAEQLGGAQACLDRTVAYVKERRQFGRAIGSFQAVKHTLADMLVQVEMARSAVDRAVAADADPESALVAQIWCADAFRFVSAETVQLHGGIGFTWEHDAHLYFRRARADVAMLGTTATAREELAALLAW